MLRESKRAFVESPAQAKSMDDAAILGFKARAQALGAELADALEQALSESQRWTAPEREVSRPRELSELPGVQHDIEQLELKLRQFFLEEGFDVAPSPYKAPTFFVAGLYFPTLAETYWRLSQELKELEAQRHEMSRQGLKDELLARWDSLEPER